MKKFLKFSLCLIMCLFTIVLTACGGTKKEVVNTDIATKGNGGTVVTRGDYIYFVNGYSSYEVFTKDNLSSKFEVGGLYRAKFNGDGKLNYTDNGSVEGAERISSNLVGFESTSLYVFGNYIYYATPNTEVDKNGSLQNNKLNFYRVDIAGGKTQKIYSSNVDYSEVNFEFYYTEGAVYLLINENNTLKRVECYGKFNKSTISSDITSLALHRDTDNVFTSDTYKNIFYTKTNDDGKIEIFNYNIATNRTEYKVTTNYKTCELVYYKFDHLYYKASKDDGVGLTCVYRMPATVNAITSLKEQQITFDEYDTFYFLDNESSGYIVQSDSKTYYLPYGNTNNAKILLESKIDIMTIYDNHIYYKSSNDIKRVNMYEFITANNVEDKTLLTLEGIKTYQYDIDQNNLYVYADKGENTYLYSIYLNDSDDVEFEAKLLGVYQDSDISEE